MVDAKSATSRLLGNIRMELISFIDQQISEGIDTKEQWFPTFNHRWSSYKNWTADEGPFRKFRFLWADQEYSFKSLLRIIEEVDLNLCAEMYDILTEQVKVHIAVRLMYWRDQQAMDGQATLNAEHEQEVEGEAA